MNDIITAAVRAGCQTIMGRWKACQYPDCNCEERTNTKRALEATARHATEAVTWHPISTAPKDGTHIVLCRATDADGKPITGSAFGVFCQVAAWWEGDGWTVYSSMVQEPRLHFEPTHWCPLPAAPKET